MKSNCFTVAIIYFSYDCVAYLSCATTIVGLNENEEKKVRLSRAQVKATRRSSRLSRVYLNAILFSYANCKTHIFSFTVWIFFSSQPFVSTVASRFNTHFFLLWYENKKHTKETQKCNKVSARLNFWGRHEIKWSEGENISTHTENIVLRFSFHFSLTHSSCLLSLGSNNSLYFVTLKLLSVVFEAVLISWGARETFNKLLLALLTVSVSLMCRKVNHLATSTTSDEGEVQQQQQ